MNNNNQKIKLAVLDLDETLIKGQSQRLLISFFHKKGYLGHYKFLILLLWFMLFKLNIFKNIKPIVEFATSCIKGMTKEEVDVLFKEFFDEICIPRIYNKSKSLVDILKTNGYYTLLISTAVDQIVSRAQQFLNIDKFISTRLEINGDLYTGKIVGNPVFGENKTKVLGDYIRENDLDPQQMFAFADHLTDIKLLTMVGNPFAVNPSPKMLKYAETKKWTVIYLESDESFQHFKSNTKF